MPDASNSNQSWFAPKSPRGGWSYRQKKCISRAASSRWQSASPRDADATLASEPFIRYERTRWGGRLVDGYLRRAGIRPRERYELHALDAIAVLVDQGLGVSLVPDWAPPWPEGLSLRKLPTADRTFARHIGVLWARYSVRLRLVQNFVSEASVALLPPRKVSLKRNQ